MSSGERVPITLGVDVGGVIVDRIAERTESSLLGTKPLESPPVAGVVESLRLLAENPFEGRVHIVSKAGASVAANTRAWLAHLDFFARTGISPLNLHFVDERPDKAQVCRRLEVTHFVDDELEVLSHLAAVHRRYLFTGGLGLNDPPTTVPPWATTVGSWLQLLEIIRQAASD